jgi:DNA-binding transcriptional LysR family regulator
MQLEALRLFIDVADTQSFTDAARLHHCTPVNASHSFHAVEKALGTLLAVPGLRRLQLNQAGRVSHDYCRQIVGLADEMGVQIARVRASGIETLHVAACPSIGLHRLPPLLDRLKTALTKVEIQVGYDTMARVHQAALRNEVDLGLVPCPRHLPGLAIEIIREVPFLLVCLPEHPFARLPLVTLAQLPGQPLIVWTQLPWRPLIKALPPVPCHRTAQAGVEDGGRRGDFARTPGAR